MFAFAFHLRIYQLFKTVTTLDDKIRKCISTKFSTSFREMSAVLMVTKSFNSFLWSLTTTSSWNVIMYNVPSEYLFASITRTKELCWVEKSLLLLQGIIQHECTKMYSLWCIMYFPIWRKNPDDNTGVAVKYVRIYVVQQRFETYL